MIGCEDRLRNDLYCVEWAVKLYSNLVVYRPELVDELAAVVGVADRVWIPLDLEPLQLGTVLRQADDDLVDVDASAQTQKPAVRCPHPENPEQNRARMPVIAASPSADYITLHYKLLIVT